MPTNFWDAEHILFYILLASTAILVMYVTYHAIFRKWNCSKCGKPMQGVKDEDSPFDVSDKCGKCSGWRRITHKEYNEQFGIE